MIKRENRHKKSTVSALSSSSTLSFSWVPLTLIILLYTSGITTIGVSASEGTNDAETSTATPENGTVKLNYTKTGNPQIDYVHDPNLPYELKGYNLSDYPFFSRVPAPELINFSCKGLKDGFYANTEYKCQVYHHCLFGNRYDFLCANFTGFDQKTFICQFVSDIDCPNSALFWHRNDALYPEPTTTEAPKQRRLRPQVDYSNIAPRVKHPKLSRPGNNAAANNKAVVENVRDEPGRVEKPQPVDQDLLDESEEDYSAEPPPPRRRKIPRGRGRCKRGRCKNRRRRPRPRPVYYDDEDYYDDDDYEYEDYDKEYYEDRPAKSRRRDKGKFKGNKGAGSRRVESLTSTKKSEIPEVTQNPTTASTTTTPVPVAPDGDLLDVEPTVAKTREEIFIQSRPPPKIRPPVPKNERNKFDSLQGPEPTVTSSTTAAPPPPPQSSSKTEYDDYYDDDYQSPSPPKTSAKPITQRTTTTTTEVTTTSTTPAPTTHSPRMRLFNFRTQKTSAPRSTTPTTTIQTTTTKPPTKATTRGTTSQTTTQTTTTTEAPQYEYEYEYEDDIPSLSSSTEKSTTIATTTTTTTTQKPSRNNNLRGKRPQSSSSIQTSTSVTVQEDPEILSSFRDEESDASQNAINRRRSSWNKNQPTRNSGGTTPNSITSTSEKFRVKEIQQQDPEQYDEPVITVKSAPPTVSQPSSSSRTTETPVIKTRPSRFWQRPAKVVPSSTTTTTEAPVLSADYSDYQDESESVPVRYNNNNNNYNRKPISSSTTSASAYRNPQVSSGNSEEIYNNNNQQQYSRSRNPNYNSSPSSNINAADSSSQYLRSTQTGYRGPPSSTRFTVDKSNYASNNYNPSPSSIGLSSSSHFSTSSMRPEFISLLREDEDPYYDAPPLQQTQLQNPHPSHSSSSSSSTSSRRLPTRTQYFGGQPYHQSQKNLYGSAQETYSTFVSPPSRFNSAFMSDFGHGHPSMMFPPYGNQQHIPMMMGK